MKKNKKSIVGKILGFILIILCVLCFSSTKIYAITINDILSVDEIPVGSKLVFNDTIDFYYLENNEDITTFDLFGGEVVGMSFGSNHLQFNVEEETIYLPNAYRTLYENGEWSYDNKLYNVLSSLSLYLNDGISTSNENENFINFLKANCTLQEPIRNITLTFKNNSGSTTYATRQEQPGLILMDFNRYGDFDSELYDFKGWSTSPNQSIATILYGTEATIEEDTILYEVWERWSGTYYTISFNVNGGIGSISNREVAVGDVLSFPNGDNLYRSYYTFQGWSTDPNEQPGGQYYRPGTSDNFIPTSNITFYAIWERNLINITYILNGGMINGNSTFTARIPQGTSYNVYNNIPTKSGYNFTFYSSFQDGTGRIDNENYTYEESTTIYANYEVRQPTIPEVEIPDNPTMEDYENLNEVVETLFVMGNSLLNFNIGWFSIGGIVAIVLSISLVFFIMRLIGNKGD